MCHDWGEAGQRAVRVLEGETSWLSCPLFSHPTVYNYTSAQRAGLNLFWYHVPAGQDLEQPIEYSQRLSKERERLWLQPATMEDKGQYICMLSNKSSCTKIAMRLEVLSHEEAGPGQAHEVPVAVAPTHVVIPFQEGETLECPNLQDISKMADDQPTVTWHNVNRFWNSDREVKKGRLVIHLMLENYQDLYYCFVSYHRHGKNLRFTRVINVTAVSPSRLPKVPSILYPTQDHVYTVKLDTEVRLQCTGMFPYLEGPLHIWWTVDGKTVDQLSDTRFSKTDRPVKSDFGDRTEESVLLIQDFQTADLDRKYQCSVRNQKGNATRTATLQKEDDKEFDVYISYARQYEEENFVLSTLRRVLENELGYTVCIFDRDSLPGGTITDETLTFVRRSRRLLVVLSPGYAARGSQALLELKAGLDGMALGGHLRVILVQYRPLQRHAWVRELRRARVALALVRWQGDKSNELTSYFWKRLRVELPMRRPEGGVAGEVGAVPPRRLESQNSTSSQTGLITNTMKEPQKVLNLY
ncbi:interleukin-1 receptor accessory protein isoform X3 [Lampris incognitus]|uniref:interleukin-1 receptor accessory protein isoform X3 n=1 Tax=Lampris incognitus TaxID=2546036 RepID=UPI0024B4C194|nr:interleukin-1 receptor accessory protein isoform X3 [Lampris incognitus]